MKSWPKILTLLIIFVVGMAGSCLSPKTKMYLVVTFDVEDYISPESEGIDDIPKWLAEIMSEEGVTGTFFVIGEKARSLEKRGRQDVIAAMAKHDIGSHTNFGSIHPTVTEQLEKADWEEGVSKMAEQETAGIEELERIFGTPVTTLARHGGSYGPQLIYALGQMKAGLPELSQKVEAISLFAGHPCKIRTQQFWDFNFYYGENRDPGQWKTPDMRPLESMKTAQKNFRRLIRFLNNLDGIEITTFHALMKLYTYQKERLTKKELREIADQTIKEETIFISEYFSPAEAFAGYVQSIIDFQQNGSLPRKIKIKNRPLGPLEMPISQPEISRVTVEEVYELAREAKDYIVRTSSLPSFLKVRNFRIGTGSLFVLFSAD